MSRRSVPGKRITLMIPNDLFERLESSLSVMEGNYKVSKEDVVCRGIKLALDELEQLKSKMNQS